MAHIAPWFPAAKFGVFIHWTLKNIEMDFDEAHEMTLDLQRQWARERFTAENFDARQWARTFKSWGAKYAVLTTKHHIGFALFDAPGAEFTSVNSAPAKRDIVAEYCQALREEGLKVGLYYSLPDWSHPDYASCTGGDNPRSYSKEDQPERWQRFIDQMFAEIRHLCTAYGKIDLMWFDGDWERTVEQWHSEELAEMMQKLQPHMIYNNRLRHPCLGHYGTPESSAPLSNKGNAFWEFCTTPGRNWDGQAANEDLKQPGELVRIFGDMISIGGNLLLNIAPAGDGTIPDPQKEVMGGLGEWITTHAEAVYNSEGGLPLGLFNGGSTRKGSVLYLLAYDAPRDELVVKGLQGKVNRVTHLTSGTELEFRRSGGREKFGKAGWLFIKLPAEMMEQHAAVVRVEFEDDQVQVTTPDRRTLTWRGRPVLTEQATYESRE
ncbi:MAG: alpha-L-fucosidase [Phycisphaerae bacterium]